MRILCLLLLVCSSVQAQDRTVHHRYAPAGAFAAICFPSDWQKTVVTERGELAYDFGPGPYARPLTRVGIALKDDSLQVVRQYWEDPRIPVATTELAGIASSVRTRAFALVRESERPEPPAETAHLVRRIGGLTGTFDWASPPAGTDSVFRNVAWGVNRPVRYRVTVPPGSDWNVAFGLCEPYKSRAGMRILELRLEGAMPLAIDPLLGAEPGRGLVRILHGRDVNGDGTLEIEAHASLTSPDPNVTLSAFWLFPPQSVVSEGSIIAGDASPFATLAYDCGPEERFYVSSCRLDALEATVDAPEAIPLVTVTTRRDLQYDARRGVVTYHGAPHMVMHPKALTMVKTGSGYVLELPAGTPTVQLTILHGPNTEGGLRSLESLEQERRKSRWYWQHFSGVPPSTIQLPDSGLQALLEASIRNLYQLREVVDGVAQFQPGPSVYRGLWVHDALWHNDAALALADTAAVRENLEAVVRAQQPDGRIRVMDPYPSNKETGAWLFSSVQFALSSGDSAWLHRMWPRLMRGVRWIRSSRNRTLQDTSATYVGLLPPSFADGGLSGVTAEYGGVYASLIGLAAMTRGARLLGRPGDQREIEQLFDELYASFRVAARRDIRRDAHGHCYLPMMVGDTSSHRPPQQAQWGLCEALYLGRFFGRDDSLVRGTLAMLETEKSEGLPLNSGWLQGGLWPFMAGFVGMAHIWQGEYNAAGELLYAYANHASELGTWVEEQLPRHVGTRTTGDGSNASASSLYIALVRRMLLLERGDTLEILAGVPPEWIVPGHNIAARGILTESGPVSFQVRWDRQGKEATLEVEPVGRKHDHGGLRISFRAFILAGYRHVSGVPAGDSFLGSKGQHYTFTITR